MRLNSLVANLITGLTAALTYQGYVESTGNSVSVKLKARSLQESPSPGDVAPPSDDDSRCTWWNCVPLYVLAAINLSTSNGVSLAGLNLALKSACAGSRDASTAPWSARGYL